LWGESIHCDDSVDAGSSLFLALVEAWKDNHVDDLVHIMLNDDQEEITMRFICKALRKKAGIESKLIRDTQIFN
jgi:CRISPR/Cas system-associated endonuclease Cas1